MEGPAAPPDERLHEALHGRDLRSVRDLTGAELGSLITLATDIKRHTHRYDRALTGRTVAMLFEKPSLRTRVSFAVAAYQLGAQASLSCGPAMCCRKSGSPIWRTSWRTFYGDIQEPAPTLHRRSRWSR